jgi:cobalt-zinc-cadmium efflux system protein
VQALGRARPSSGFGRGSAAAAHRGRLIAVLILSLIILAVEVAGGIAANSLALLADAGHMLTDVAGMGLALLAIWFAGRSPTNGRTYGYLRLEILATVVNGVLLFGIAGFVLFEAWQRLAQPPAISSAPMLAVAFVGLLGNAGSLFLLRHAQRVSLNMRGAYLEVMGDFAGSVSVIAAAAIILATGWTAADAVASALIGILILPRTFALLREATDVLLEGSPKGVAIGQVRQHILEAPGVADCHDLHAWTITSGVNVVSAHVVLTSGADPAATLDALCACLAADFDIEHSTFQLETEDRLRLELRSHP